LVTGINLDKKEGIIPIGENYINITIDTDEDALFKYMND